MRRRFYGIDTYGRYVEIDGERYMIEFYPFPIRSLWTAWYTVSQAFDVFRWHVGIVRQYGVKEWRILRAL